MTALAADRNTQSKESGIQMYPVLNDTEIFKGALVAVDDTGFLVPADDAAAFRVVGVSTEHVLSPSTDTDGDKKCRVQSGRSYLFAATSITQAMVGDVMFVVDDQTFDDVAGTNGVPCGRLVEYVSTTSGYVFIPNGGLRKAGIAETTWSANDVAIVNDTLT
jgi:hypothetical protein